MSYPNDNYRPPLPNPTFASTPNSDRQRPPRFAYAGPQNYPRPGSSASKPNPEFSLSDVMRSRYAPYDRMNDSMIGNCNDTYMDTSMPDYNDSYQSDYNSGSYPSEYNSGSYQSQSQDSVYYTCNETFSNSPRQSLLSPPQERPQHPYKTNYFQPDVSILPSVSTEPVRFKLVPNVNDPYNRRPFYKKKKGNQKGVGSKKNNDGVSKHVWRCSLCDIVFTSSVPYNMHKSGTRHAKKLKLQAAAKTVQSKVETISKDVEVVGNTFRCELCGIITNSPYQLKMHLEGLKHKTKLLAQTQEDIKAKTEEKKAKKQKTEKKEETIQKTDKKEETKQKTDKKEETKQKTDKKKETKVNGGEQKDGNSSKTEHPVTKPAPAGLSTKTDFHCGVCELYLNSDAQLQQHLAGRFHKAKVGGTTLPFHGKKKAAIRKAVEIKFVKSTAPQDNIIQMMDVCQTNPTEASSETTKNVQNQPETSKDSQPDFTMDVQPETSKDS